MRGKNEATLKGIAVAIIATFAAKGFGFIREIMLAKMFGTTSEGDALIIALNIPTVLASGFALALSTIYIPTYHQIINSEKDNKEIINSINTTLTTLLTISGIAIVLLVYLYPNLIIKLFASGFNNQTSNLCILFVRTTILSVLPILYGGLLKAYGQIINQYGLITFLGCIINICIILALILFKYDVPSKISIAFTVGYYLYMLLTLIIILKAGGFGFSKPSLFKNRYIRMMGIAFIPAFISNIVTEINQMVDKNFASGLSSGTISALNYSSKLVNMITAVLGTAISSVLFVKLSRMASNKENENLSNEIVKINSVIMSFVAPIFWIVLSQSSLIVTIVYGHGNFNSDSVNLTDECLKFYSFGIIAFNLKAVWIRCYNASLDTKTPAINSSIAVIFNIILNFLFVGIFQHKGLAMATVITSVATDLLLIVQYKKINNAFQVKVCIVELIKPLIASFSIYLILAFVNKIEINDIGIKSLITMTALAIGTITYFHLLMFLKCEAGKYYDEMFKKIKCKFGWRK